MSHLTFEFFKELDVLINEITRNNSNPITANNKIVEAVNDKIHNLYVWLSSYSFASDEEEIAFFKEKKPKLISRLIFHKKQIEIEANMPIAKEFKIKYLKKEIEKVHQYAIDNSFFYEYYRAGYTHNDLKYFTRNRDKNLNYYEVHIINYDSRVSTSHDFNVAQIMANEQLILYLEDKLESITNTKTNSKNTINSNMYWTGSKIDLIELVYALQTTRVINEGKMDLKELAKSIGQAFNIEIEDAIYRAYVDIKSRKEIQTKFINALATNLKNRIDSDEM